MIQLEQRQSCSAGSIGMDTVRNGQRNPHGQSRMDGEDGLGNGVVVYGMGFY